MVAHCIPTDTAPPTKGSALPVGSAKALLAFGVLLIASCAVHCGLTVGEPAGGDGGGDAHHDAGRDGGRDAPHLQVDAVVDTSQPPADTGSDACKPEVPDEHRPTTTACSTTRPPGYNAVAGVDAGILNAQCTSDSQCTDGGINGRCTVVQFEAFCTFDTCTTDSECGPSSVCHCGPRIANGKGRNPNACVPATCHVDSDCGPGGYCSPAPDPCWRGQVADFGVAGYHCHTAAELCSGQCSDDAECQDAGGNCEWQSFDAGWMCQFGDCT